MHLQRFFMTRRSEDATQERQELGQGLEAGRLAGNDVLDAAADLAGREIDVGLELQDERALRR
jgi:hypothetical protein